MFEARIPVCDAEGLWALSWFGTALIARGLSLPGISQPVHGIPIYPHSFFKRNPTKIHDIFKRTNALNRRRMDSLCA
jgi:hypothetical protein